MSHVKTFPLLGMEPGSTARDQDSGQSLSGSFAKWDRASQSWRTSQLLLTGDSAEFSDRWPIAGTMRNGVVSKRSTWVPRISATDSLLLPTPTVKQQGNKSYGANAVYRPSLQEMARRNLWPTPTARDWKDGTAKSCANVPVNSLLGREVHQRRTYPTPRSCSAMAAPITANAFAKAPEAFPNLETVIAMEEGASVIGGALNPTFVEWLQGFPAMWTVLSASVIASFRKSRKLSGDG